MTDSITDILLLAMYVNQHTERFDLSSYIIENLTNKTSDIKLAVKQLEEAKLASFNDRWRLSETKVNFTNYRLYGKLSSSGVANAEAILAKMNAAIKLQTILKYIADQHELNPTLSSFSAVQLRVKIFKSILPLKEVEYLCRQLASNGDVLNGSSKHGIEIGYLPATDDALYSEKYLMNNPSNNSKPTLLAMKHYDLEINEVFDKKYLKVYLKELNRLEEVAGVLRLLGSVKTVNLSPSHGKPNQNLTAYPNRVYDIEETKAEVDYTLKNYFERGKFDPVFPTNLISNLSDNAYGQIVDLIVSFGKNLEKFQNVYPDFGEENFRNYFLPMLNIMSQNHSGTGETFNKNGKTDILIQDSKGTNVFIAECKLWKGAEELKAAISQLLDRYVTWRDEKVALIVFNKDNKKFSELIEKAITAVKAHPQYKSGEIRRHDTSFSFQFRHSDDPQKSVALELILFNCTQSSIV